jgi:hypothetical protein
MVHIERRASRAWIYLLAFVAWLLGWGMGAYLQGGSAPEKVTVLVQGSEHVVSMRSSVQTPPASDPSCAAGTQQAVAREGSDQAPSKALTLAKDPAAVTVQDFLRGDRPLVERQQMAMTLADANPDMFNRQIASALSPSSDRALRLSALELLKTFPGPPSSAVAAAKDIVFGRADPDMISSALEIIRNGDLSIRHTADPLLASAVSNLASDVDPKVRAESVMLLPMIDQSRDVEPLLMRAINDFNEEVRRSAIQSVINSGSRGEEFKQALMALGLDQAVDLPTRIVALGALGSFRLTPQEIVSVQESRRILMSTDR